MIVPDYPANVEFETSPGLRAIDLIAALALVAAVFFAGMTATLLIGFLGAPGGASSECTGQCRTFVDAGAGLMAVGTIVVGSTALILMARSWWLRRPLVIWPLLAIPLLAVLAGTGFALAMYGPA